LTFSWFGVLFSFDASAPGDEVVLPGVDTPVYYFRNVGTETHSADVRCR